jgi:hypothetical protein
MGVNLGSLIGLKDDASDDDIAERVVSLSRIEKRLFDVTGKDSLGEAMAVVVAAKDAQVQLDAERKLNREWQERHAREQADAKAKTINALIESAVLEGRVSLKNTNRIEELRALGHDYDDNLKAMKSAISMLQPRPIRQFQAPPPVNTVAAQLGAIDKWKKDNPGKTSAEAYVALSQTSPALFADTAGVAVEE